MEYKSHNIDVSELFRRQLENAEVIPGPSVNAKLMGRLARKEFVRFNPSRFNIYYLGLIAAAAITAGIILLSDPKAPEDKTNSGANPVTSDLITITEPQAIVRNENRSAANSGVNSNKEDTITGGNEAEPATRDRNIIKPAGISNSLHKELFSRSNGRNKLQIPAMDKVLFVPSATYGCSPLKIRFNNIANGFDTFSWTFGDGGYSDRKDPEWIFDEEGEYRVLMTATGKNGSKATCAALITVWPKPRARFEITPEKAVIPDEEIQFLNYSANGISYEWDFGDGNFSSLYEPKHSYEKFSNYNVSLVITSEHGCTDTLVVANAFSGSEYFIKMPNAFIPNPQGPSGGTYSTKSDERAEIFHPNFSGVSDYQLKIFSKIGIPIFESNDINLGWDGYYKGQLSNPGVYIWKIRGNFINGEPFIMMGDVTLLKN